MTMLISWVRRLVTKEQVIYVYTEGRPGYELWRQNGREHRRGN